jgi:hypothetical protein
VNSKKVGDLVPPLLGGSLVTAAVTLTLLRLLLALVEVFLGPRPEFESSESSRPAVATPRPEVTATPPDFRSSNRNPLFGDRRETTT